MRIVHVANFHGPRSGGLRTTMRELAREYGNRGVHVELIVPGRRHRSELLDGVLTHTVAAPTVPRSGGYRVILDVPQVLRLLRAAQPDVVEISDRLTLLRAADWARAHGIRSAMFAHERIDGVIGANAAWLPATSIANAMNRRAWRRVDHVVATTAFAAGEFRRIGHEPAIVPLGLDTSLFSPARRAVKGEAIRDRPLRIGMVSRLSQEKSPELAIEALRVAHRLGLPAELHVLGDGPLRPALESRAAGLPVTFHGFIAERSALAQHLADFDVVLAPGPIETFGLAALEALGCGTPVVANRRSALPEVIRDAGLTADNEPTEWFIKASTLAAAGAAGRARARSIALEYSWRATADRLLNLYGAAPTTRTAQSGAAERRQAA